MRIAAQVAALKRKHPEDFCADPRCLWRTKSRGQFRPCPTHDDSLFAVSLEIMRAYRNAKESA